jgi:hypothetical protein
MKNRELIALLQAQDPDLEVEVNVTWAEPEYEDLAFYARATSIGVYPHDGVLSVAPGVLRVQAATPDRARFFEADGSGDIAVCRPFDDAPFASRP